VRTLADTAIAEAGNAESEVTSMPAGGHAILGRTREAIERRARTLLDLLHDEKAVPADPPLQAAV
jgi:hypothetical protein